MQTFGVGLIGYGLGGKVFHAPFVDVTPGLTLRAVVSRDPAKVQADWPGMTVVSTAEELCARQDIDLVIVSSPDALHAEHAIAALDAGKHVVVDKPFATSIEDARRICDAADRSGTLLTIFHNRRWDADFLTLRKLVDNGCLGEITWLESHFDRWRPTPAQVWKEEREGGVWLDLGPHLVDQALVLFGEPQTVWADIAAMREGAGAPDYFHVALKYPTRRVVLHATKLARNHDLRFAVHGTGGSWIKHGTDPQEAAILAGDRPDRDGWGHDTAPGILTRDAGGPAPAVASGDYKQFWRQLADTLSGKAANPVPPHEALSVMKVLDAGLRSSKLGCEVSLD